MHTRRFISLLLGAWFAWIIVALSIHLLAGNTATYLAKWPPPEAARALTTIGQPLTLQIFRFVAAEVSRVLLERGAAVDLILVAATAWQLFVQDYSRRATILGGILLLLTCASALLLTPQFVAQGRVLDFRPLNTPTPEHARFANLSLMFAILTGLRVGCAVWITAILLRRGFPLRRRRSDFDAVDHA